MDFSTMYLWFASVLFSMSVVFGVLRWESLTQTASNHRS